MLGKYSLSKPFESKKSAKTHGHGDNLMNSLRKRVKEMNSHKTLSSTQRNAKKEARVYYVKDVKDSLGQFINNEEFMDSHLTHFMESISTFKMFGCSYLPVKPHKVVELPEVSKDKITLVFDLDETLIHSQILDWHIKVEELGAGKFIDIVT